MNTPLYLIPIHHDVFPLLVSLTLGVAFELIQVRNGPSIGKPTYRGITPLGTPEALSAELADTWVRMRGVEGSEMRRKMVGLRQTVTQSWREGESRRAMLSLERFL